MNWKVFKIIFINPLMISNYWIMLMLHYREDENHFFRDLYEILINHFPEYS